MLGSGSVFVDKNIVELGLDIGVGYLGVLEIGVVVAVEQFCVHLYAFSKGLGVDVLDVPEAWYALDKAVLYLVKVMLAECSSLTLKDSVFVGRNLARTKMPFVSNSNSLEWVRG